MKEIKYGEAQRTETRRNLPTAIVKESAEKRLASIDRYHGNQAPCGLGTGSRFSLANLSLVQIANSDSTFTKKIYLLLFPLILIRIRILLLILILILIFRFP